MRKSPFIKFAGASASICGFSLIVVGVSSLFFRMKGETDWFTSIDKLDERPFMLILVGICYVAMNILMIRYYYSLVGRARLQRRERERYERITKIECIYYLVFALHCYFSSYILYEWNSNEKATLHLKKPAKIFVAIGYLVIRIIKRRYPNIFKFVCIITESLIGHIAVQIENDDVESSEERIVYWCLVALIYMIVFRVRRIFTYLR